MTPRGRLPLRAYYTWAGLFCAILYGVLVGGTTIGLFLWSGWDFVGNRGLPWSAVAFAFASVSATYALGAFLIVPFVAWLIGAARHPMFVGMMAVSAALLLLSYVATATGGPGSSVTVAFLRTLVIALLTGLPPALLWQRHGDPRPREPDASLFD